jgi:hypothetical protein
VDNGTVLIATDWQCKYGIQNPENIGQNDVFLGSTDASGDLLDETILSPNMSLPSYTPPDHAVQIHVWGDPHGTGSATLEYDTPSS